MPSVIMLNGTFKPYMLSVYMLSAFMLIVFMLSVFILSVDMLNVVAPYSLHFIFSWRVSTWQTLPN